MCATCSSYISTKWQYREKQYNNRKRWEIISRSHMLLLWGERTLCRKLYIINIQHLHWIKITTSGNHHDPNKMDAPTTNIMNSNWILLETCSTISYIRNKNLVQNIQTCDAGEEIRTYKNGENQDHDHIATFKILPFEVLFNKKSLASIHVFDAAASKFKIAIDIELYPSINAPLWLHKGNIQAMRGRSILFWNKQQDIFRIPKQIIQLSQLCIDQQFILS